jgi:hypothetical protein
MKFKEFNKNKEKVMTKSFKGVASEQENFYDDPKIRDLDAQNIQFT